MSKIQITRKIRLFIDLKGKELTAAFKTVHNWQYIIPKVANYTASHHFVQQFIGDFFYLHDEVKLKFVDRMKEAEGILTTSKPNTTYQLNSKRFKGDVPMGMVSAMNNDVVKNVSKEFKNYARGDKSLRSYRGDIPMPVPVILFRNWRKAADSENWQFEISKIPFRTFFGRDYQNNKYYMDAAMEGKTVVFCDSKIQFKDGKIFLLAVFEFEKDTVALVKEQIMEAELSIDVPISCKFKSKSFEIGTKEEFLHGRMSIQEQLRRLKRSLKYGAKRDGRKLKMQAIERFEGKEKKYVTLKLHTYSRRLIDTCITHNCGTLVLKKQKEKEAEAKAIENKVILRNWSYYGLIDMIKYKCQIAGIELVIE